MKQYMVWTVLVINEQRVLVTRIARSLCNGAPNRPERVRTNNELSGNQYASKLSLITGFYWLSVMRRDLEWNGHVINGNSHASGTVTVARSKLLTPGSSTESHPGVKSELLTPGSLPRRWTRPAPTRLLFPWLGPIRPESKICQLASAWFIHSLKSKIEKTQKEKKSMHI